MSPALPVDSEKIDLLPTRVSSLEDFQFPLDKVPITVDLSIEGCTGELLIVKRLGPLVTLQSKHISIEILVAKDS